MSDFGINGTFFVLLGSAGTIFDSGSGLVQTRMGLFSAELQEERMRFSQTILLAVALVTLGTVAFGLNTATIVSAFWESARLAVLSGLTLV